MKKLVLLLTCMFFSFAFIPTQVVAEEFVFGSFPIPLMVIDGENGIFVELTKGIAKQAGLSVVIKVDPPLRTQKYFQEGKIVGLFPALDVMFPPGAKIERSDSIYLKQDFVFTKKGSKMIKTLEDLKGLKVGITRGYPYARSIREAKGFKIEEVDSDEINAKKLVGGRIDAFVVEEKTGLQAFKDLKLIDKIQYDQATPLSKQEVYYAFPANDIGKMLAPKVSVAMNKMKADGTFGKIMSKASQ